MTTATAAPAVAAAPAGVGQLRPSFNTLTNKSTSTDRIASYQRYNADTAQTLEKLSLNNSKTDQRLRDCGHIDATVRCNNGHQVQIFRNQCREYRLCPACARRRSKELFGDVWPLINYLEAKPIVGYKWRLITLTTQTCNHKEAVTLAISAFSKLWRNLLKRPYVAGIRSLEFGPISGNVHIHLLYYGPFINQADLSQAWGNLTGAQVVDVRLAGNGGGIGLKAAVKEVLKYMTNYNKVEDKELLVQCWLASKGRRLVQRYGLLYGRQSLEDWVGTVIPKRPAERVPDATSCPVCGSTELTTVISLRGPPLSLHGVQP